MRLPSPLVVALVGVGCNEPFLNHVAAVPAANESSCPSAAGAEDLSLSVQPAEVTLTWTSQTDATFDIVVKRNAEGAGFAEIATLPGDARHYTDTGCTKPDSWCEYQVQATSVRCQTKASPTLRAYTMPGGPTNLVLTTTPDGTGIGLSWQNTSRFAAGNQIERANGTTGDYQQLVVLPSSSTSYTDSGLPLDSAFTYRVAAFVQEDGGTDLDAAATAQGWTLPSAAQNVVASSVLGGVSVQWTDPNTTGTGVVISWSPNPSMAGASTATLPAGADTYSPGALSPDTDYHFQVTITNPAGGSAPAGDDAWTYPARLSPTSTSLSTSSIELCWTDPNAHTTGYVVEGGPVGQATALLASLQGRGQSCWTHAGIPTPSQHWSYNVYAVNAAGRSPPAAVEGWTLPATPTSLAATTVSATQIRLQWSDPNSVSTGTVVAWSVSPDLSNAATATLAPGTTTFSTSSPLAADTQYYFRVTIQNAGGASVAATTDRWTLPAPLTALTATSLSTTSIKLCWTDPNTHTTGYVVEGGPVGQATATLASLQGGGQSCWTHTGITAPSQRWSYKVYAINAAGLSAAMNCDGWTCPIAPANTTVVTTGATSVSVQWADPNGGTLPYAVEHLAGASYVQAGQTAVGGTSLAVAGLGNGQSYTFRIRATGPWDNAGADPAVTGTIASGRTSALPVVSLGQAALDSSCALSVPGSATYDQMVSPPAAFASADGGFLGSGPAILTPSTSGLAGLLSPLPAPGVYTARWAVTDSYGGHSEAQVAVTLDFPMTATMTALAAPQAVVGSDAMPGRQLWLGADPSPGSGCQAGCSGKRGSIAAGGVHTCVLDSAGGVRCWGSTGAGSVDSTSPSLAGSVCATGSGPGCQTLGNAVAISAGFDHTCALTASGGVRCWGANESGVLGNGNTNASSNPVDVNLANAVAVSIGSSSACAVMGSGNAVCWGSNTDGALGNGTLSGTQLLPGNVCASGSDTTCSPLSGVVGISTANGTACALLSSGSVMCWGTSSHGELGNGSLGYSAPNPVAVCLTGTGGTCSPLAGVVSIAGNGYSYCAVLAAGGVKCWGLNAHGELGDGTTTDRPNPVDVCVSGSGATCAPLADAVEISVGTDGITGHACALLNSGNAKCWGNDMVGEIGTGTGPGPYVLNATDVCLTGSGGTCVPMSGIAAISIGAVHTCALMATGAVMCWGAAILGRLGNGSTSPDQYHPTPVCTAGSGACATAFTSAAVRNCGFYALR